MLQSETLLRPLLGRILRLQPQIDQLHLRPVPILIGHIRHHPTDTIPPIHKIPAHLGAILVALLVVTVEAYGVIELVEKVGDVFFFDAVGETFLHVGVFVLDGDVGVAGHVDGAIGDGDLGEAGTRSV